MTTEIQTQPQPAPELTILYRVAAIPLVATSLDTIHQTLTNNAYTRSPYATAHSISKAALGYTEPLQKTIAPLIVRADGLANKGFDVVESRYPYPFKTPTEDIVKDLKGRTDQAKNVANKTIDDNFVHPALNAAQGIDQRFAPVVDYFEVAVKKVHSTTGSPVDSPKEGESPKFQYQRAYALSRDLSGQLLSFSAEQINQIRTQNVYVQRAAEAAHRVSDVASTSYGAAHERVHAVSDVMLQELQKVQQSTAALPTQLHASFNDISAHLSSAITDISGILTSPDPLNEKVGKVRDTVQQRVHPILEATSTRVQEILDSLRGKAVAEKEAPANGIDSATHGNGNGNSLTN
ncbi:lipid droplet-associated perilipin protein [Cytidiella melzeri]|nr:lipid droplet-associated perilipin protein [Cytidiella melzeri]